MVWFYYSNINFLNSVLMEYDVMLIWGKIFGVLFGFMFFKIFGVILGLLVGYFFDKVYC